MTAGWSDAGSAVAATTQPPVSGGGVRGLRDTALRVAGGAGGLLDTALRVAGGVVAVALAMLTAIIEVFYAPLRIGGMLIGLSALVAMVVNYWLLRYTVAVTGRGWAGALPALVWFGMMLLAADRRTEGDQLIAAATDGDTWPALLTIFVGSLAFAAAGYRLLLRSPAKLRL